MSIVRMHSCLTTHQVLFGNTVKPRQMLRPLALTGFTIHKKTLHERTKQKEVCFTVLEIYTLGQVNMLNKTIKLSYTSFQSH